VGGSARRSTFNARTDHNNQLFMNQKGSLEVLNWKLSIQHFKIFIELIKGVDNIPAFVFSRLVQNETDI